MANGELIPANNGGTAIARYGLASEELAEAAADSARESADLLRWAWIVMIAIALILVGWGSLAPLNRGVIGPGRVSTASARLVLQSTEGGPIEKIFVREGQPVKEGAVVAQLDRSTPATNYEIVNQSYLNRLGEQAMLRAYLAGTPISWPAELTQDPGNQEAKRVMEVQAAVLASRRAMQAARQGVVNRQVAGLSARIGGLSAQSSSVEEQRRSINEELAAMEELYEKGYARRSQVEALRRARAELAGSGGMNTSEIGQVRQSIGEAQMNLTRDISMSREDAAARLAQLEAEIIELRNKRQNAKLILDRTTIRAPASGVVLAIPMKTPGAIVAAGEPIVEIVPDSQVEIVGQIRPNDIENVYVGQTATIRLPGLNLQTTPNLLAKVTFVSADAITDKATGIPYYEVRVALLPGYEKQLNGKTLTPGMPAEIMMDEGSRTALQYLVQPITNAFSHAFRE